MDLSHKHIVALITGASRGFGHSITKALTAAFTPLNIASLTLLLHARPTSHENISALSHSLTSQYPEAKINVTPLLFDLRNPDAYASAEATLKEAAARADLAFLFNNAAVLQAARVEHPRFAGVLREGLETNTIAPALFVGAFARAVPSSCVKRVALTSSPVALRPFKSWGAYCASKAATLMLHRILAVESPGIRVLCYAPGPLVTDMTSSVLHEAEDTDPQLKAHFEQLSSSEQLVDPDESAAKLISLLLRDEYQSGEQIDFYDV